MPVEFLTDDEAASFGRYGDSIAQADLERFFFLDFSHRPRMCTRRAEHVR